MAVQDMTPADLAAVMKDNNGFGDNGWWIILLFIVLGGWGRGFGGNTVPSGDSLYPWMENQQNITTGFSGLTNALTSGFANAETAATARQMADMNQEFANQMALQQGFSNISAQLASCCCENRLATANQTATILAEHCADRQALSDGIRDIIAKLDSQDLYAERRENEQLRQQLAMANLAASQIAQTTQIIDALKPAAATA